MGEQTDETRQSQAVKDAVEEARRRAEEAAEEAGHPGAQEAADAAKDEAKEAASAEGDAKEDEPVEIEIEDASTEQQEETDQDAADQNEGDKKPGKKDRLQEKIDELNDRLTRQLAEFENFRNRTEKEKSHMYAFGARDMIEKILPVIDNFERGLTGLSEEEKATPFAEGMEMVYKQMMTALEAAGVSVIPAVGETFDPEVHNAVMHEDIEGEPENTITEELQKGYKYKDTVVRHSMVKVVN